MVEVVRKKSPRAPSMPLEEALERSGKAYDKERLHAAPTDVVAQNIGYKGANNGAALAALASLRYYGLLERPREGLLAVTKDYENYRFAPNEAIKQSLLHKFLRNPALFKELLDQYEDSFPSAPTLKYELIQRNFLPTAADTLVEVLLSSVDFVGSKRDGRIESPHLQEIAEGDGSELVAQIPESLELTTNGQVMGLNHPNEAAIPSVESSLNHDRIPIRLTGNRRAWLIIPEPLYEADKRRLKAQIDLLLTEEDNE